MEPELAVKSCIELATVFIDLVRKLFCYLQTADLFILYEEKDVLAAAAGRTG
jgi:hypothetical protein